MTPATLLYYVASTMFYQPLPEETRMINLLVDEGLIQPIKQGKLVGYALTKTGYQRWLGHRQASERT